MVAWGNLFVQAGTISGVALAVTHYRSATPVDAGSPASYGRCDGTQSRDGNTAPTGTYFGWPCWDQPGRAPTGGSPLYGALSPVYGWMNVDNSTGKRVSVDV